MAFPKGLQNNSDGSSKRIINNFDDYDNRITFVEAQIDFQMKCAQEYEIGINNGWERHGQPNARAIHEAPHVMMVMVLRTNQGWR